MKHVAINIDGASLHVRQFGEGRPVVLFHESPRSSQALMDLGQRIDRRFSVLAFDTPGYGLSDPLPFDRPSIDDFADQMAAGLRALGLKNVPVYGIHTGATIAARMAVRHPDLVAGLVFDGFPLFSAAEREQHEAFYLPQFPPQWDGGHILALWSRVRDQYAFFPWYLRGASARITSEATLDRHRAVFRDFLRAGMNYATAYSASFRFDGDATLRDLRHAGVAHHIIARPHDVLTTHLGRIGPLPSGCSARTSPADAAAWAEQVTDLLDSMPGQTAPAVAPRASGRLLVAGNDLICHRFGQGDAVHVLLPDGQGGPRLLFDTARRLARGATVIIPCLSGHDLGSIGHSLSVLLDTLGVGNATLSGSGSGAELAADITASLPERFTPSGDLPAPATTTPRDEPLPPRWDGADLLATWYRIRDAELSPEGAAARGELIAGADLTYLHSRFIDEILAGTDD